MGVPKIQSGLVLSNLMQVCKNIIYSSTLEQTITEFPLSGYLRIKQGLFTLELEVRGCAPPAIFPSETCAESGTCEAFPVKATSDIRSIVQK